MYDQPAASHGGADGAGPAAVLSGRTRPASSIAILVMLTVVSAATVCYDFALLAFALVR